MSVWTSVEALRDYVYASRHIEVFRYCLWWIPAGHIPGVSEGRERLERYQQHGPTPYSFWFSKLFPAPVQEVAHA
jgi:hypothetical protein